MSVADLLSHKGNAVFTIEAGATLTQAAMRMREAGVGALVVASNRNRIDGMISERDIMRALAEYGGAAADRLISEFMTQAVVTCSPRDGIAQVARTMTNRRIRHLPVVAEGVLVGMVSIGDVLKTRIDEVELEANVLRDVAVAVR